MIIKIYIAVLIISALLVFRKLIRKIDAEINKVEEQINELFSTQYEY